MNGLSSNRRHFLKRAGGGLVAAGAVSGMTLASPWSAMAQQAANTRTREMQAAITPQQALQKLKDGNDRFVRGQMLQRDFRKEIAETGPNQFPFAAVVGCIDSRESARLIFDQGIGDLFSARIAGNFVNDDMLGSLEFACAVAGAKYILVVGHTECGAVKGAVDDVVLGNLTITLANIKPAVAAVSGFGDDRTSANPAFVQAVADKNVELALDRIRQRSPILRAMEENGEIGVSSAMYDVTTGRATFL